MCISARAPSPWPDSMKRIDKLYLYSKLSLLRLFWKVTITFHPVLIDQALTIFLKESKWLNILNGKGYFLDVQECSTKESCLNILYWVKIVPSNFILSFNLSEYTHKTHKPILAENSLYILHSTLWFSGCHFGVTSWGKHFCHFLLLRQMCNTPSWRRDLFWLMFPSMVGWVQGRMA